MRINVLFVFAIFAIAGPVWSQSEITLEDFDLGSRGGVATQSTTPSSGVEDCLLDATKCIDKEMQAGAVFSLEDVVNLKIKSNAGSEIVSATVGSSSASASVALQSIDMEILFDYNSDTVRPDQMNRLFELAEVLNSDKFSDFTFLFVGHSDAKGSAAYNLELSTRRAQAVANFVQASARLSQDQFAASGMGFARLKDRSDPLGALNRRVQLVLVPK